MCLSLLCIRMIFSIADIDNSNWFIKFHSKSGPTNYTHEQCVHWTTFMRRWKNHEFIIWCAVYKYRKLKETEKKEQFLSNRHRHIQTNISFFVQVTIVGHYLRAYLIFFLFVAVLSSPSLPLSSISLKLAYFAIHVYATYIPFIATLNCY